MLRSSEILEIRNDKLAIVPKNIDTLFRASYQSFYIILFQKLFVCVVVLHLNSYMY